MGMSEAKSLAIESWTLYAIAIIVIIMRMCAYHVPLLLSESALADPSLSSSRRILLGAWKKLQIDDYIMLFIAVSCQNNTSHFVLQHDFEPRHSRLLRYAR